MTNNRTTRSFEFEIADAPMLVHALAIAASTAMMCGHRSAQKRLQQYRDIVKKFAPPEAAYFDEEAWAEMGMALVDAKTFRVSLTSEERWSPGGHYKSAGNVMVEIGESRWFAGLELVLRRLQPGAPEIKAICNALQDIAPMDCVGTYDNLSKVTA